jgi:hypothetical protein
MRKPRTRTLIAAAAAAAATATAAVLIASTAGASTTATPAALTAATGSTGTTLSVAAGESAIAIGQKDTVSGTLQADGAAPGHRVVELYRYSARLNRWRVVRIKETNANGSVQFTVRPLDTAKYELGFRGNAKLAAVRSGVVTIAVTPTGKLATTLSVTASATTINSGGTIKLTGALTTVDATPVPGRLVFVARYNPTTKKWARVAVKRTGPKGMVFIVRAPSTTAIFQLVFPGGPRFAGSHSATVTVTVTGQPSGTTPAPTGSTPAPAGSTAASVA